MSVKGVIAEDMKGDAGKFDGRIFSGKTVGEYFGNQGAAISSLADIMKSLCLEPNNIESVKL